MQKGDNRQGAQRAFGRRAMRGTIALTAGLAVAGCATVPSSNAPENKIAAALHRAAAYRDRGPPTLTLYTRTDASVVGQHTALMIDAGQRVVFDPSGSFKASGIPERDDVLFGITPQARDVFENFYAQGGDGLEVQRVEVPAAVAERALQLALAHGAVGSGFCTDATVGILRALPGFEGLSPTFFPGRLADQFGALPGVTTTLRPHRPDQAAGNSQSPA